MLQGAVKVMKELGLCNPLIHRPRILYTYLVLECGKGVMPS